MGSETSAALAARPREAQWAAILAAIGAWTAIVPYLGKALGLTVNVPWRVEFADHVVPGAILVATGMYLHKRASRGAPEGERNALFAAGLSFLAGFWVLATHVPLLQDASEELVTWEAAIWHSIAALPIVVIAGWFLLRSIPDE